MSESHVFSYSKFKRDRVPGYTWVLCTPYGTPVVSKPFCIESVFNRDLVKIKAKYPDVVVNEVVLTESEVSTLNDEDVKYENTR